MLDHSVKIKLLLKVIQQNKDRQHFWNCVSIWGRKGVKGNMKDSATHQTSKANIYLKHKSLAQIYVLLETYIHYS